jgi:hypothetical protein
MRAHESTLAAAPYRASTHVHNHDHYSQVTIIYPMALLQRPAQARLIDYRFVLDRRDIDPSRREWRAFRYIRPCVQVFLTEPIRSPLIGTRFGTLL